LIVSFLDEPCGLIDRLTGAEEGTGHAGFSDQPVKFVSSHIVETRLRFADIGIRPIDEQVDGMHELAELARLRNADDSRLEIAIGGGATDL